MVKIFTEREKNGQMSKEDNTTKIRIALLLFNVIMAILTFSVFNKSIICFIIWFIGLFIALQWWHSQSPYTKMINNYVDEVEQNSVYENLCEYTKLDRDACEILVRRVLAKEKGFNEKDNFINPITNEPYKPSSWDISIENIQHIRDLIDKETGLPELKLMHNPHKTGWQCSCGVINRDDDIECIYCKKKRYEKTVKTDKIKDNEKELSQ